ncbi:MAG: CDP-diacylglycerol--glycerol-3-phosphate 3-phosphatidyltransferase, partial [Clostridiales bacterium]|nr:CDP-diacylglycerol--glycerol-3-phosphate 3-phosphatidyltransferase [Clostridiales bacterium]
EYARYVAAGIFIVASLTDFLDGYIARKNNLITNFGIFMDPIADKLLVCSALIAMIQLGDIPAWVVILIVAREFVISGFRLIASDSGTVLAASKWGKIKTVTQMMMTIFLLLNLETKYADLAAFNWLFIYLSAALTIISAADYIIKNNKSLSGKTR